MTLPFVITADQNDRARWLAARRQTIGASESAIVLGVSPWGSLLELWGDKTGRAPRVEPETETEWTFWGHVLENAIIDGYGRRTGRAAVPFGLSLRSTQWDWLSATPDALVTDDPVARKREPAVRATIESIRLALSLSAQSNAAREAVQSELKELTDELETHAAGWWPLQIKNIGYASAEHWAEGVPIYYTIQCVHEALVWGADKTTAAALIAGQRLVWDDVLVETDEVLKRRIVNLTRAFMDEHVRAEVEPLADGSESAKETLARLYPSHREGLSVQLSSELHELALVADDLKQQQKEAAKRVAAVENRIRQAMGAAERCHFVDGSGYTYRRNAAGSRVLLRKQSKEGQSS